MGPTGRTTRSTSWARPRSMPMVGCSSSARPRRSTPSMPRAANCSGRKKTKIGRRAWTPLLEMRRIHHEVHKGSQDRRSVLADGDRRHPVHQPKWQPRRPRSQDRHRTLEPNKALQPNASAQHWQHQGKDYVLAYGRICCAASKPRPANSFGKPPPTTGLNRWVGATIVGDHCIYFDRGTEKGPADDAFIMQKLTLSGPTELWRLPWLPDDGKNLSYSEYCSPLIVGERVFISGRPHRRFRSRNGQTTAALSVVQRRQCWSSAGR